MGGFFSSLFASFYSGGEPSRIMMLGLDGAGKTTILYKIKLGERVTSIPTIGFNVETVSPCKGVNFTVWDIGGQDRIRPLWKQYFSNTKGLVYVVDSSDVERLCEAKEELFGILEDVELAGVPVVIIANKQDMPSAMSPAKLIQSLELQKLTGHRWHMQGGCAPTGEGIYEAYESLSRMIKESNRR